MKIIRVPEIYADHPHIFLFGSCGEILCLAIAVFVHFKSSGMLVILLNW